MKKSLLIGISMAALLTFSVFCLLYAMGAFNFINLAEWHSSEVYVQQQARRIASVNKSPRWRLVAEVPDTTPIGRDVLLGMRHAVEQVNAQGGLLGKALELELVTPDKTSDAHAQMIHEASRTPTTALYLGPWTANHVPASRAIAQYYALPMLSVTLSDNLPPLTPDTSLSLVLPPRYWSKTLIDELVAAGHRRVLILGPDKQHTAGAYASHLERRMGASGRFEEVFRIAFPPPMNPQAIYRSLRTYQENRAFDALIFTGETDDLAILGPELTELGINVPLYGSDLLDSTSLPELVKTCFPAGVRYLRLEGRLLSTDTLQSWHETYKTPPRLWVQYGILAVRLFCDAVTAQQGYHPELVAKTMRKMLEEILSDPQAVTATIQRSIPEGVLP